MADKPTKATHEAQEETPTYSGAYGTKNSMPMWAWVLIYLVIGAIVYYAVYALYFAKKSPAYSATGSSTSGAPAGSLYNY